MLISTRRMARPTVALARRSGPGPKMLWPLAKASWLRTGPLTSTRGADPPVLAELPWRLYSVGTMASTAAMTTGMYSGRHPAMTALMATFSAVITRPRTGSTPMTSEGWRPTMSRNRRTFSSVGGTTGSPSVQPREYMYSKASSRPPSTSARWEIRASGCRLMAPPTL